MSVASRSVCATIGVCVLCVVVRLAHVMFAHDDGSSAATNNALPIVAAE